MAGDATFSGTTYQARVLAYVEAHVLTQRPLRWLGSVDDTPQAVSGETGGPGDDVRVELGPRLPAFEVQAKHGLTAGKELDEVVARVGAAPTDGAPVRVVLAVDRASSKPLYTDFAGDLERLRAGRRDPMHVIARRLLADGVDEATLRRLAVVPIDVDRPSDPEVGRALAELESVLVDPAQAAAAWAVLAEDAGEVCARRTRRDREQLVALLSSKGIGVRPPPRDAVWQRRLDFTRDLLVRDYPAAALAQLDAIAAELDVLQRKPPGAQPGAAPVAPAIRARLWQQRSAALRMLDRHADAVASAQRALDIEPDNVHALTNGALAAMLAGEPDTARALAERATAAAPDDPNAWGVRAQVAAGVGDPIPTPPAGVADAPGYRAALANVALMAGDWAEVLEHTAFAFSRDHRPAEALYFRLVALVGVDGSSCDRAELGEAERLATELMEALGDEQHHLYPKALVLRAEARRLLGRADDADADLARAHALAEDDPDAIGNLAQARLRAGDRAGALDLLRHPRVDDRPGLLAMRARAQAEAGDADAARATLRQVLGRADEANNGGEADQVRLFAAEVALAVEDAALADQFLAGISAGRRGADPFVSVCEGRSALLRGDVAAAVTAYDAALAADPARQDEWLGELARGLTRAGRPADALARFERLLQLTPENALPPDVLRAYAFSLLEVGRLADVQGVLDRLTARVPADAVPAWALQVGTDLALRREDPDAAVAYLQAFAARGPLPVRIRLELARQLVEAERPADAHPHLEALRDAADLSPRERMLLAQLFHEAGRTEEALPLALRAFRDAPQDAGMHRALIVLTLHRAESAPAVDVVGRDTYVRLQRVGGPKAASGAAPAERAYLVYADGPIDPFRHEIGVAEAATLGLLGCREGDVVVQNAGRWNESRWAVAEVLPAVVFVVRQVAENFHATFPDEPFLVDVGEVGDGTAVQDLAPLIASVHARREHVEQAFDAYREKPLPLECLARITGSSVPAVMAQVMAKADRFGPLVVEWPDADGQEESRRAAGEAIRAEVTPAEDGGLGITAAGANVGGVAPEVVLTWPALVTAAGLGLLDLLAKHFTLVAPRALRLALREELAAAERVVEQGHSTLGVGDAGLSLAEFEPGHPLLVRRRDDARDLLAWFERSVRVEARPLEAVGAPASFWRGRPDPADTSEPGPDDAPNGEGGRTGATAAAADAESGSETEAAREASLRDFVGPASLDAVAIARHRGATVYADDMGLRLFFTKGVRGRSFSTVGLVRALADAGLLSEDARDGHLLRMVENRYATVPLSAALLAHAVRRAPTLSHGTLAHVFALLAGPAVTPAEAARVAAGVLRTAATAAVRTLSAGEAAELAVAAMAARWPAPTCARLLGAAAADTLALLPADLQDVRRACAAAVRRYRRPPGADAGEGSLN